MDQRLPEAAVTDWRGLCEELVRELECWRPLTEVPDCLARARAALAAEAVGEGPTDEELLKLARAELNNSPNWEEPEYDASNPFPYEAPGVAWLNFARAVLARFGNQPAPPAEGEVAELARLLRLDAHLDRGDGMPQAAARFDRAANLLERQAAPVPVPVSERLPGAEDCDAEGRCWIHQPHEACPESPAWELMLAKYASANYEAVCWLPFNALPLPSGEVE